MIKHGPSSWALFMPASLSHRCIRRHYFSSNTTEFWPWSTRLDTIPRPHRHRETSRAPVEQDGGGGRDQNNCCPPARRETETRLRRLIAAEVYSSERAKEDGVRHLIAFLEMRTTTSHSGGGPSDFLPLPGRPRVLHPAEVSSCYPLLSIVHFEILMITIFWFSRPPLFFLSISPIVSLEVSVEH